MSNAAAGASKVDLPKLSQGKILNHLPRVNMPLGLKQCPRTLWCVPWRGLRIVQVQPEQRPEAMSMDFVVHPLSSVDPDGRELSEWCRFKPEQR